MSVAVTEKTKKAVLMGEPKVACPFINLCCARGERHEKKFIPDIRANGKRKRGSKGAWVECKASEEEWRGTTLCCPYESRK